VTHEVLESPTPVEVVVDAMFATTTNDPQDAVLINRVFPNAKKPPPGSVILEVEAHVLQ
jgi:hypothetical protein